MEGILTGASHLWASDIAPCHYPISWPWVTRPRPSVTTCLWWGSDHLESVTRDTCCDVRCDRCCMKMSGVIIKWRGHVDTIRDTWARDEDCAITLMPSLASSLWRCDNVWHVYCDSDRHVWPGVVTRWSLGSQIPLMTTTVIRALINDLENWVLWWLVAWVMCAVLWWSF